MKKNKKSMKKIVLLAKSKQNSSKQKSTTEVLISKALTYSNITHDDFVSINVLKEYDDIIEEIKHLKT